MKSPRWTLMDGGKICTEDISQKQPPLSSRPCQGFTASEGGLLILKGNHLPSTRRPSAIEH
ncbi:MAG: hypothetical protein EBU26_17315 [Verrucomicrobia bacterium]|nr:hypothetical protein [Verrucomicrobiota bacterium]